MEEQAVSNPRDGSLLLQDVSAAARCGSPADPPPRSRDGGSPVSRSLVAAARAVRPPTGAGRPAVGLPRSAGPTPPRAAAAATCDGPHLARRRRARRTLHQLAPALCVRRRRGRRRLVHASPCCPGGRPHTLLARRPAASSLAAGRRGWRPPAAAARLPSGRQGGDCREWRRDSRAARSSWARAE